MEGELNVNGTGEKASMIEIEEMVEAILGAYQRAFPKDFKRVIKYKLLRFTEYTYLEEERIWLWKTFSENFTQSIEKVMEFIEDVPGFDDFIVDDQATLAKV